MGGELQYKDSGPEGGPLGSALLGLREEAGAWTLGLKEGLEPDPSVWTGEWEWGWGGGGAPGSEKGELGLVFLELSEPILQSPEEGPAARILCVIRSVSVFKSSASPRK